MKASLRSVVVVGAVLGGLLVACTPQTVGSGSVTYDIDGYCRLEAKVGQGGGGSYVQVRTYGVLQGPGPFDGCLYWTKFQISLGTTDGGLVCDGDVVAGGEGECVVIGNPTAAWLQAQRTGDLVSANVTVVNPTTDGVVNVDLYP